MQKAVPKLNNDFVKTRRVAAVNGFMKFGIEP
jgi:hypothetical protein